MLKEKPRLLYILSPSYSGSTLLTMLLAQHPELATIGELKATSRGDLDNYFCSCGEVMKECPFWKELESRASEASVPFSLEDFGTHFKVPKQWFDKILSAQLRGSLFEYLRSFLIRSIPSIRSKWSEIIERNRFLIEQILDLQSSSIFLDGSKDPNRLLYFIQSGHWDVRVIYMVRDGRAQAHSTRRKERHGMTYAEAARDWCYTIKQMNEVVTYLPLEKVFKLKYEELCYEPNKIINAIWEWLDTKTLEQDWSDVDVKQTEHHILGNNMRTKERIKIAYDDSWLNEISQSEVVEFNDIAGAQNRQFGYK